MRLKTKLTSLFLVCGILPLCIAIACALYTANKGFDNVEVLSAKTVETQVSDQLNAVRDIKKSQIENYFGTIANQIKTFSNDRAIIDATVAFRKNFRDYNLENNITDEDVTEMREKLATYYTNEFATEYKSQNENKNPDVDSWVNQLDDEAVVFQYNYIRHNSNPLGSKHLLDKADDSNYGKTHAKYHPMVRDFLEKFGYYDIFLVDPETGDIVYSVFKELDYGTSLKDGPFSNTNFAECFAKANKSEAAEEIVLVDYKQYSPSYEAPASFIASPVFDGDKKVGILMFQMPIDYINQVMGLRSGMGNTGETYLVGNDNLMRCDSYKDPENRSIVSSFRKPEQGKVNTEAVGLALKGETATTQTVNYQGKEVLCAYTPVELLGNRWALLAEIETEEAFAGITQIASTSSAATSGLLWYSCLIGLISGLGVMCIGWVFSGRIATPIQKVADFARKIANGEFDGEDLKHTSKDETGELADSFRTMSSVLNGLTNETARLTAEAKNGNLSARGNDSQFQGCYRSLISGMNELVVAFSEPTQEIRKCMDNVANGDLTQRINGLYQGEFEELKGSINSALTKLEDALSKVSSTTADVANATTEVHSNSQKIAEGSTEQASSLEEIASSLEEMTSMTRQSTDSANEAKGLAKETRDAANTGKQSMHRMSDAIEKIKASSDEQAKIVQTIDEIAFQTNLLALNAAVEAARAGDAGRGFAVVAEEVRNLAQRSAEAARTTSEMIQSSVESSNNGVKISKEVAEILETIYGSAEKTDELVADIAAASNEQSLGIDQVNTAIGLLDSTTQKAADISQRSAETAMVIQS